MKLAWMLMYIPLYKLRRSQKPQTFVLVRPDEFDPF